MIDVVGARDDVGADQLADLAGGLGAGLDGRPHAADVALDQGGDIGAADLDAAGKCTLAALSMASVASIMPTRPLVSIKPRASPLVALPLPLRR